MTEMTKCVLIVNPKTQGNFLIIEQKTKYGMVRWGYKVTPALCRLQEWFCPLFSSPSGSALGSYVLHAQSSAHHRMLC